jgi:hypothetical protein
MQELLETYLEHMLQTLSASKWRHSVRAVQMQMLPASVVHNMLLAMHVFQTPERCHPVNCLY